MRPRYNRQSLERALDIHTAAGRIIGWRADPARSPGYLVELNTAAVDPYLKLRSLRETSLFVAGLASAAHARPEREDQP